MDRINFFVILESLFTGGIHIWDIKIYHTLSKKISLIAWLTCVYAIIYNVHLDYIVHSRRHHHLKCSLHLSIEHLPPEHRYHKSPHY